MIFSSHFNKMMRLNGTKIKSFLQKILDKDNLISFLLYVIV